MADDIVERKRPERFFKYMSRQTAKIVLANRTLRWSTPALLNDPFDVQFDLHLNNIDRQRIKTLALPKVWDVLYGEGPYEPKNRLGEMMAQLRGRMKPMSQQEFYKLHGREPDAPFEDISFHSKELEGVIFGCLAPSNDIQELSAIIKEKYPHARLQQAVKATGEFKLLIHDLEE
jgi:hypothetical protein